MDWTAKKYRGKRTSLKDMHNIVSNIQDNMANVDSNRGCFIDKDEDQFKILPVSECFNILKPIKPTTHMPGMPQWYRNVCDKISNPVFQPGPVLLSAQTTISPYLLRMSWKGYPLYHHSEFGWGYLKDTSDFQEQFIHSISKLVDEQNPDGDWNFGMIDGDFLDPSVNTSSFEDVSSKQDSVEVYYPGSEQKYGFHKLPHKNGPKFNVGNPLSKDFQNKMETGVLLSQAGSIGQRILQLNSMLSFWRISKDRIYSQFVVWYDESQTQGAIIPNVITAGTATRRAVEPTWLTASNAKEDRVGSELKSVVEAPPGYCLVGADVDSQELWIASLLGDAHFIGIHGCTAMGWMTLQGNKADGTDLHSVTAKNVGINRNHAKILNYGRIYGAGKPFAILLLQQFNPSLSHEEAEEKAMVLYQSTKGSRKYTLNKRGKYLAKEMGMDILDDTCVSQEDLKKIAQNSYCAMSSLMSERRWDGGSESFTFNKLENIANSVFPTTPVLGNCITKALRPEYVGDQFITSRINWVVQSSAVDYLHLLLVCMKWLFEKYSIDGRLCISIHDEVRYLVKSEDKYRAAVALQISNLLTRCMFASQLRIYDLPMSVAFFSAVDIDRVLRKEVNMDCKTPSNHLGLESGYKIPHGEALDIYELSSLTNDGNCLYQIQEPV
jgi:DNA polymerase gamma 1